MRKRFFDRQKPTIPLVPSDPHPTSEEEKREQEERLSQIELRLLWLEEQVGYMTKRKYG